MSLSRPPSHSNRLSVRKHLRQFPYVVVFVTSLFSILGSAITLLGWLTQQPHLTDWWNDGISMFPNPALCAIFCGTSLLLMMQSRKGWQATVARVLAGVSAAIGGLTMVQHLTGVNLGIDTILLQRPWGQRAAMSMMRMGPPAAFSFLILGTAIIMCSGSSKARRNASALGFLPITISFLSLIGYLFQADQLFGVARFTGIARQTSIILMALGIAVIAAVPEHGFMAALRSKDTGGVVLRRLLLPILLVPLLLGWLRLIGEEAEVFDSAFGSSLRTLIEMGLLFALLWWTSKRIGRHATAARDVSLRLAAIVQSSSDAIVAKSLDGTIQNWNEGAEHLFGYSAAEVVGRNITIIIPPDRLDEEKDIQNRLRRGESIEHYETIRVRKDGSYINVSLTVSPLRDASGKIIGASKIARDITERIRADEVIRRREAELQTLANSIPQLAWMANPDGHIFWYNQGWYDYTGTTFEEMEGWGWQSVHDAKILPKVLERWNYSLETGEQFEMEFPLRGHDGTYRWFLTRVKPLRDEQGKVLRWFGTNTDIDRAKITEQQLREKTHALELLNDTGKLVGSKLELEDLLQAVTDVATKLSEAKFGAFFYNSIDENGEVYLLYSLSGAPREAFEKFGMPRPTPLFGPTFEGKGTIRSDDILQDPRYGQMEPHRGMPEGHLPVRSYLAVPVVSRMGEVIGGLFFGHPQPGVFTEATERIVEGVAAQAGVAIDNARLYENLKQAAKEREEILEAERSARAEAERLNLMKDEFLATLSHELRTPLNAILGWSQILGMDDASEEDMQEGIEAIERNAWTQTKLIEDLLDMSRIVSGKVRLEVQPLDLADVIEQAIDSVRTSAEAKQITLHMVVGPQIGKVSGDPTRLQQVFWNLLSNAIKFTPKEGRVDVILEQKHSHMKVQVRDSGIGISPEFISRVFDRFRQADSSSTRTYGGLGLGLSIVKNLVELHGGSVEAKSDGLNQGATFTVMLPVLPVIHGRERRLASMDGSFPQSLELSGRRILVVDDELDTRQLLKRVLMQYNVEVELATNADEAMALLQSRSPDLIVSDIGMPGVDGYEFIRRVRNMPASQGGLLPAIALTAFARHEDRNQAMQAGYQVHMPKPIQPQELLATIANLLNRDAQNN